MAAASLAAAARGCAASGAASSRVQQLQQHTLQQHHYHLLMMPTIRSSRLLQQPAAQLQARRRTAPRRRAVVVAAAAAANGAPVATPAAEDESSVSYEWSWQRGRSHLPDGPTRFDAEHPLPDGGASLQVLAGLLEDAAAACEALQAEAAAAPGAPGQQQQQASLPSGGWVAALLQAAEPQLAQAPAPLACELLQLLARLDVDAPPAWMERLLDALCASAQQLSSQQLADSMWALSNLRSTPSQAQWGALLAAGRGQLQEFYGPDLARYVCAAGSIFGSSSGSAWPAAADLPPEGDGGAADAALAGGGAEPASSSSAARLELPPGWGDALLAEAEYQLTQFPADLQPFDLARLATGLADLQLVPGAVLAEALLTAVYRRTRTIEEKGAVDFALARLEPSGKRSMHYDPRWTHEELKWLPRRERDKRRLIKEGWVRSQWTGWKG